MGNKTTGDFMSFNPVRVQDWIVNVSVNNATGGICVVMFHMFRHIARIRYVLNEEEATDFIVFTLQNKEEE